MKRTLAILLVLAMALSLAACVKKKTTPQDTSPTSAATTEPIAEPTAESTAATDVTDESTIATKATTAKDTSSKSTVKPTTTPTTKPTWKLSPTPITTKPTTAPTSKPTEKTTVAPTTKPTEKPTTAPTTKPTEPPHTHTWKDATCKAPKTCSGCGVTEGSVGSHNFKNGVCTICNAADVLNPNNKLKIYGDTKEEYVSQTYIPFDEDMITVKGIFFHNEGGDLGCVLLTIYFHASEGSNDPGRTTATYNGKTYYRTGDGYNPANVTLTDSDILVTTNEGTTIKMVLLGNGNLKVTASTDSNYPVDMLLSTNWS